MYLCIIYNVNTFLLFSDITGTYSGSMFDELRIDGVDWYKTFLFRHFTADVNQRNENIDRLGQLLELSKNIADDNFIEPSSTESKGPFSSTDERINLLVVLKELYDIMKK